MFKKIESLLRDSPGLKAKTISSRIGEEKAEVNSFLYSNRDAFFVDDEYCWYLAELRIEFPAGVWITSKLFEDALAAVESPLTSSCRSVVFVLLKDSKLLLDAAARLLALCNQLAATGKDVRIDFGSARSTRSYLDRLGFFRMLSDDVAVMPSRPRSSKAEKYHANNDGVVEVASIDPAAPDNGIPGRLQNSFERFAAAKYHTGIFTVLSELFNNIYDHSETRLPAFAALQVYPNGRMPHVQAVVSDSGRGILRSLQPVLNTRYKDLTAKIHASGSHLGVELVKEIFKKGRISSNDGDGRGLGLKTTGDYALKFNATISVRQDTYEVVVRYAENGKITFSERLNLHELAGTHICFDFFLDA